MNFKSLTKIEFCWRKIFEILIIHRPSLAPWCGPLQQFGPIDWAVLTFIGHKQTDRQASIYVYIDMCVYFVFFQIEFAETILLFETYIKKENHFKNIPGMLYKFFITILLIYLYYYLSIYPLITMHCIKSQFISFI